MNLPKQILIVEDTADIRMILEQFFQMEGYMVSGAANGAEALEQLKAGARPDLIIADLLMPVMDGFRLCESLREDPNLREIPIMIMTGDCHAEFDKAKALGVQVLRKPMNFKTMLKSVEDTLHPPVNSSDKAAGDSQSRQAPESQSGILQNQNYQAHYRPTGNDTRR